MASIEAIEGIGKGKGKKLRSAGIASCERLLAEAGTKKGRKALAAETGIDQKQLLEWANRADLMRVKGIGSQYSDLLERAGVDTVKELRKRRPDNLSVKMIEINDKRVKKSKKTIVKRPPSQAMVEAWATQAKDMEPMVSH